MPLFPSAEWMEAFCANVQAHPDAPEAAAALEGVYRFVVEPAGPLRERHQYHVRIRSGPDGSPQVERLDEPAPARLTLAADYTRWAQLIRGELSVGVAVMLRRLRVSGDIAGLRRRLQDVKPLTDSLSAVQTEWR